MNIIRWIKNQAIPWYTSLGLTERTVTLEVAGRKTGRAIRVSLSVTKHGGRSYFVSLGGESAWVRNLRAAGGNAVILSGGRRPVRLVETPPALRAPVMLAYVQSRAFTHSGSQASRHFFGLGPNPTLTEMEAISDRYLVFEITPAAETESPTRADKEAS